MFRCSAWEGVSLVPEDMHGFVKLSSLILVSWSPKPPRSVCVAFPKSKGWRLKMKKRERLAQCLPGFKVRKICCFHSLGFFNFCLLSYLSEVLLFQGACQDLII